MSGPNKYLLVSLPTSISRSNDKEEALSALRSTISTDNGTVLPFKIPEFKIGAVDVLLTQADDLGKLEAACGAVVAKIGDTLRSLLEGDEEKIAQQKTVNDSKRYPTITGRTYMTDFSLQSQQINTYGLLAGIKSNTVQINL